MMPLHGFYVYASILFLLIVPTIAYASPQVLPIINQNEFQACFFGWCQTVAPAWLHTDFVTSTNIYNITNSTVYNITNITNYIGANMSSITCGGTDKVSAIDNATGEVTCSTDIGITSESEPMWNGNYSLVAFSANQGDWNVNSSVYCSYIDNSTERNLFTVSNMTVTANLNVSFYNTTYYLSSASVPTCSKYYNVSTLLWCDCYNNTHKWVSNIC